MTVYPWRGAPPADFAVIGDPVAHSKSPTMHHAAYYALSLPLRYVAVHVPTGDRVAEVLAHLAQQGYRGVNVTLPHKRDAFASCGHHTPEALAVGAVNTVDLATMRGHNTDLEGFRQTLPDGWPSMRTLLLGAGGSAVAAAVALRDTDLTIWNRTTSRAHDLAEIVGANVTESLELDGFDLVVNATSASHGGESLPLVWPARPGWAYDLSYTTGLTPFLQSAKDAGWPGQDGRPMLAEQGALALEWWHEQSSLAPTLGAPSTLRAAMRGALGL